MKKLILTEEQYIELLQWVDDKERKIAYEMYNPNEEETNLFYTIRHAETI